MADTVTSQTILDGTKTAIMKFTNVSDGTGESAVTKVDVSALQSDPQGNACAYVSVEKIEFSCVNMGVRLLWDATTDVLLHELGAGQGGTFYFDEYGGQPDPKASGYTGDINFTTISAASDASYVVTLTMRKHYA
jgi:hypothetical protein